MPATATATATTIDLSSFCLSALSPWSYFVFSFEIFSIHMGFRKVTKPTMFLIVVDVN